MKLTVREIVLFALLGSMMFVSKLITEALPNIHLIGVFIVALTVVYRQKALYPIYVFVFLTGLYGGFSPWWVPYLYIWTILWGMAMLLPYRTPKKWYAILYMAVCAAHGLLYGTLYAPAQALLFGLTFEGRLAWIVAGLPWDALHGVSNFFCGVLIMPLVLLLRRIERTPRT